MKTLRTPVTKAIIESEILRINSGDELFTLMLQSLEDNELQTVHELYKEILKISISIEQRIAANNLDSIAYTLNHDEIMEFLCQIYGYDN